MPSPKTLVTKHEYTTISKARLIVPPFRSPYQARDAVSHERDVFYVSSLANFRVSDPKYGAVHKDVHCRHCAKDGAFGGYPAPSLGAYTVSLLCVVSTERCVTQVPYLTTIFTNFPGTVITLTIALPSIHSLIVGWASAIFSNSAFEVAADTIIRSRTFPFT